MKFLKPLFSRTVLAIVFLIIQLILLILPVLGVYERSVYTHFFITLTSLIVIIFEINRETDSGFKLIWIAMIAIFPIFGVFLYVYVHADAIGYYIKKRFGRQNLRASKISYYIGENPEKIEEDAREEYGIISYLLTKAYAPCFKGRSTRYFPLGEDMYASLLNDIENANKYIFLEFFIINENDFMWKNIYSRLISKVKEGVEVRLIYDAMGSLSLVSRDFDKKLTREGIKCLQFSPVKPFISTYHNNRNHRKMVIIDGKYAYTGGINIADEYINRKVRFGHWKDTAVRLEGEGVKGFLLMYFKIWNFLRKTKEQNEEYFTLTPPEDKQNGYVVPFDDSPVDDEFVTRNLYLHIINSAKDYVYINTPYLIPDDALSQALKFAATRGVDVRICMPHIPDKWYAFVLGRSYYPELLKAGVKIYEYTKGFLHAKSTVSDDLRAYVGSANYDYRSLYLHYECGVYFYKNDVIQELKNDYIQTLGQCILFDLAKHKKLPLWYRIMGRILRLFASLM